MKNACKITLKCNVMHKINMKWKCKKVCHAPNSPHADFLANEQLLPLIRCYTNFKPHTILDK